MPQDLINQVQHLLNTITSILQLVATFLIAFLVVLWLTLCFWTFRDIQSRTRDLVAQIFATLLVFFFNIPGVLLYILVRPKQTLDEAYEANLQEEYLLQDLEEREICHTCRVKTQPDFIFCYNCRTRLRRECIACGQVIKIKWSNCPFCGSSQKPTTREQALERAGLAAGRAPARRAATTSTALVYDPSASNMPVYPANPARAPGSNPATYSAADAGQNQYEDPANLNQAYQPPESYAPNGLDYNTPPTQEYELNPANRQTTQNLNAADDIEEFPDEGPTATGSDNAAPPRYSRYVPRHLRRKDEGK